MCETTFRHCVAHLILDASKQITDAKVNDADFLRRPAAFIKSIFGTTKVVTEANDAYMIGGASLSPQDHLCARYATDAAKSVTQMGYSTWVLAVPSVLIPG